MALIICRECGNRVSDRAFKCPHCGAPLHSGSVNGLPNSVGIGYVISLSSFFIFPLILGILGFVVGVVNIGKNKIEHGIIQVALSLISLLIELTDNIYGFN